MVGQRTKGRRILRKLIIAVLFLVSISALLYPTVSTAWNRYRNSRLIAAYQEAAETFSDDRLDRIRADAEEYNRNHPVNVIADVFDEENQYVLTHPYDTLLNPTDNGVMGYIEIPKIDIELVIYHGTASDVLQKGVGHVEGTSLPVGGSGTHAVLAGHRGLQQAKLFTDLDQMEEGDRFFLHIMDETLAYEVDQITVVEPSDSDALRIEENRDLVTLLTCTPYGVNSHRLLVRGARIPYSETDRASEAEKKNIIDMMDISLKALIVGVLTLLLLLLLTRRRRRKKRNTRGN